MSVSLARTKTICCIVYVSSSARLMKKKDLEDILSSSRRNNPKDAVTGKLLEEQYEDRVFPNLTIGFKQLESEKELEGWSNYLHADNDHERSGAAWTLLKSFRKSLRGP